VEPSRIFIRHLEYLTMPADLGSVPPVLRGRAQWLVTCRPAGPRDRAEALTLEHAGDLIGYISLDYGIHPASRRGRGRWVCVFGGFPGGPELDYLSHAGSSEQGLRLIAGAHQACLGSRVVTSRPAAGGGSAVTAAGTVRAAADCPRAAARRERRR
jgi:hypothetical protein